MSTARTLRCAIYTRKSSEEGLEQSFNSLDAQREACESFITSQRHEGWQLIPTLYDDGGYSGGNTDRPALQQLMADIRVGLVDLIVVYKIDRLTRSLTDFATLVQVLDAHQTSFVSVTQHFNTTTSMGRLTLNVLLSFAQFEREVTGERIRDKIAASKRKGMWMGGTIPLGYRVEDHRLVIEPADADTVRHLFTRYLALGSVTCLKKELDRQGIASKVRLSRHGRTSGGTPYSKGALYLLLKNRVYRGEIPHKEIYYPGQHEPIVFQDLWDSVQALMETNREIRRLGTRNKESSLLTGMLIDASGQRLTPKHTKKQGRRYHYYVGHSQTDQAGVKQARCCVPAHTLEQVVSADFVRLLKHPALETELGMKGEAAELGQALRRSARDLAAQWPILTSSEQRRWLLRIELVVTVGTDHVTLSLLPLALQTALLDGGATAPIAKGRKNVRVLGKDDLERRVDAQLIRRGGEIRIVTAEGTRPSEPDSQHETLLRAIAKGRAWYEDLTQGRVDSLAAIAKSEGVDEAYVRRILRCGLMAPDLIEQLIDGTASPQLTLENVRKRLPPEWALQRARYDSAGR